MGCPLRWIRRYSKNVAGNCVHCFYVQQRTVQLRFPWNKPLDQLNSTGHSGRTCSTVSYLCFSGVVSVCTDGAAVNIGMYNGVVPKLHQMVDIRDYLVHILCSAHTLRNCGKSSDRTVPYCESFNQSTVKLLSLYLQKGAKRIAQLKQIFSNLGSLTMSDGLHGDRRLC